MVQTVKLQTSCRFSQLHCYLVSAYIFFNKVQIIGWLLILLGMFILWLEKFSLHATLLKHSPWYDSTAAMIQQGGSFVCPNTHFGKTLMLLKFLSNYICLTCMKPESQPTVPWLRHSHAWWCSCRHPLRVGTRPELLLDAHWHHSISGNAPMEPLPCFHQRPLCFCPTYSSMKWLLLDDAWVYRYSA